MYLFYVLILCYFIVILKSITILKPLLVILNNTIYSIISTGEDEAKSNVMQFVTGDVVQVVGGELKNLIGRIISINEMIRSVTLAPFNSVLKSEIVIEVDLLVKYIVAGAHIKVT